MTEEELQAAIEREEAMQASGAQGTTSAPPAPAVAAAAAASAGASQRLSLEAVPTTPPSESLAQELSQKLAKLELENEAMKAALASGKNLTKLDSRARPSVAASPASASISLSAAMQASRIRRQALAPGAQGTADLERALAAGKARMAVRERGVDVAILMDCTGSMGWCIEAVKSKALDIMQAAPAMHPDAITRLAFVGYRDFGGEAGDGQFVVHDFVDKSTFSSLHSAVRMVRASGGGDAEDVTGALKKALGLSWSSSTRLIIHFGDAPCHGNRYHDGRPVNGPDSYPAGNPDGLVPEQLLKQLPVNRIDYHFARITHGGRCHTDIMTGIFKEVYDESPGAATFDIHEYTDRTDGFMPLVLKSISSSMRRSFRSSSGRSSTSSSKSSLAAPAVALPSIYAPLV